MAIRIASTSDVERLRHFARKAFADTYVGHPANDTDPALLQAYMDNAFGLQQFSKELADPNNIFLLCEEPSSTSNLVDSKTTENSDETSKLLGYAKVIMGAVEDELDWSSPSPTTGGRRSPIRLERLYVSKEAIGLRGIGTQLLEASKRIALDHKCDLMWLGCWGGNTAAMAFYNKSGFKHVGQLYIQLGNEKKVNEIFQLNL